jgi:hypothetical protein
MDCIGCDKCRLWGKVQTAGYGAALKVLFEFDETKNGENPHLRRTELVALMNTFDRISKSLAATRSFRLAVESGNAHGLPSPRTVEQPARMPAATPKEKSKDTLDKSSDQLYLDDDEFDDEFDKPHRPEAETFMDSFWEEWYLVWRAYAYVLKSWASMPKTM